MFLQEKHTFAMYFVIEHIAFNRQKNLYETIRKKNKTCANKSQLGVGLTWPWRLHRGQTRAQPPQAAQDFGVNMAVVALERADAGTATIVAQDFFSKHHSSPDSSV